MLPPAADHGTSCGCVLREAGHLAFASGEHLPLTSGMLKLPDGLPIVAGVFNG